MDQQFINNFEIIDQGINFKRKPSTILYTYITIVSYIINITCEKCKGYISSKTYYSDRLCL